MQDEFGTRPGGINVAQIRLVLADGRWRWMIRDKLIQALVCGISKVNPAVACRNTLRWSPMEIVLRSPRYRRRRTESLRFRTRVEKN